MPTGSGLWHFLYHLVRKFIRSVVSREKDMATKTHNYDAFREWW